MLRHVFGGCVSDHSSQAPHTYRSQKLKFGASLSSALKHGYLPGPLVEILVHIAKEGITTTDVFRRPGNPNDTRRIVKRLTEGKQVIYGNYSFYTLASVVKKFLLKIPGGVFTPEGEEQLLQVLTRAHKIDQIEAVHSFMETLTPAHQQLIALLFGTWFRIVTFQEQNCMSLEALARSVAGSMFHTCAEDPAKVERASRIMQFLIDNFDEEGMFGQDNIRFFTEMTHTGIHLRDIRELYHYSYEVQPSQTVRPDFIEVTRYGQQEVEQGMLSHEDGESHDMSPLTLRHDRDGRGVHDTQLIINTSTLSAPEVSLIPSPDISKRPKSLEDSLNEVRSHYQNRCLSRFNSVKRKQLERLRQRSDWFLSPIERERNNSRKGRRDWGFSLYSNNRNQSKNQGQNGNGTSYVKQGTNNHNGSKTVLQQKNSGSSLGAKASSENAVTETFCDKDSEFTDTTSRSESPASEPVWSLMLKAEPRDIVLSDTIMELFPLQIHLFQGSSDADLNIESHDSISGHHFMDLSPSLLPLDPPQAFIYEIQTKDSPKEWEDDEGGDDEEEENTTPTGLQEEEDTLLSSSVADMNIQEFPDEGAAHLVTSTDLLTDHIRVVSLGANNSDIQLSTSSTTTPDILTSIPRQHSPRAISSEPEHSADRVELVRQQAQGSTFPADDLGADLHEESLLPLNS